MIAKELKAHDFPEVYKILDINLSKLGCIMLDLKPFKNAYSIEIDGAGVALYYAKNKERFWIDGWVFDNPHMTLLYGLLMPGNEEPMRDLVPQVLNGWEYPPIEIADISFFDTPYDDEPYWCIVAHIKVTPELQEGHDRLCMLPHVKTFPGYKAHATICYIDKRQGDGYRDRLIANFKELWVGKTLEVSSLNLGGNK